MTGPFDDEETRAFYETLPNIIGLVPSILLGKGQKIEETEVSGTSTPTTQEPSVEVDNSQDDNLEEDSTLENAPQG